MFKIKKLVTFVIHKDGLTRIVDTLSAYGPIMVQSMKDGRNYSIGIYCDSKMTVHCLDNMLMLSEKGVWIRKINVRYKIKV